MLCLAFLIVSWYFRSVNKKFFNQREPGSKLVF